MSIIYRIRPKDLERFRNRLVRDEKSVNTVGKYVRDVRAFADRLNGRRFTKSDVMKYREELSQRYAISGCQSVITSLNRFFVHMKWTSLSVNGFKTQKRVCLPESKKLTKDEYFRLLTEAKREGDEKLHLLMQTICATGIRVSELRFITAEAVAARQTDIDCKGKVRTIFLPSGLCEMLQKYMEERAIKKGSVFVTKNGKPLDRSNIWKAMKKLCRGAGIEESKVFPHNLRHLFARTFYDKQKDIVRLSDILGHSSVDTTRIYTMESEEILRDQIQNLGLLRK